ncbi:cob(I)yrinic acid a,c-diamide adenosyltransferase [Candidatus Woesebacteria bacterium]|nr:cob(I)yrinic acid a,c-diamide adenosyltransferase [Candidatus Woesebacteria bacterium]
MPIYTRKGDKGETGLFGTNRRCSKDSQVFRAIGAIDELNSFLGVITSESEDDDKLINHLEKIQSNLFKIGSILAGSDLRFSSVQTKNLEKQIDDMEDKLQRLRNFILPGGSSLGAKLHYARSICRRVEREVVRLNKKDKIKPQILVYINRLSDYLFVLARSINCEAGERELVWKR